VSARKDEIMKIQIGLILLTASAAFVAPLGCGGSSCDQSITRPNPNDPSVEEHLVVGDDGLCHWPWYTDANWGSSCSENADCGANLICLAPELPICSRINCKVEPEQDTVCAPGFKCLGTGDTTPSVCIPDPAAGGGGSGGSGGSGAQVTGGAGAEAAEGGSPSSEGGASAGGASSAAMDEPNIGEACAAADDPVCKGGTFCEATMLGLCTVSGCAEPGTAKEACDAVMPQGFVCYSSPPAPAEGICIKF
jgi:hypothetical protein